MNRDLQHLKEINIINWLKLIDNSLLFASEENSKEISNYLPYISNSKKLIFKNDLKGEKNKIVINIANKLDMAYKQICKKNTSLIFCNMLYQNELQFLNALPIYFHYKKQKYLWILLLKKNSEPLMLISPKLLIRSLCLANKSIKSFSYNLISIFGNKYLAHLRKFGYIY